MVCDRYEYTYVYILLLYIILYILYYIYIILYIILYILYYIYIILYILYYIYYITYILYLYLQTLGSMNQQTNKKHLEGIKFWIPRLSQRRPRYRSVFFSQKSLFFPIQMCSSLPVNPGNQFQINSATSNKNHQKSQDSSITHHDWRFAAGHESPGAAWPQATMSPSWNCAVAMVLIECLEKSASGSLLDQDILTDNRFKRHTDGETPTYRKTTT